MPSRSFYYTAASLNLDCFLDSDTAPVLLVLERKNTSNDYSHLASFKRSRASVRVLLRLDECGSKSLQLNPRKKSGKESPLYALLH